MLETDSLSLVDVLAEAISCRTAKVGVIGLGYVGLPLIDAFTRAGFQCVGFDVDPNKIEDLNAGRSYIKHISSSTIQNWQRNELFQATADMSGLGEVDVVLICVPTPLTDSRDPDLSFVESTARAISENIRSGQLIVLESTTYPSTTRDVVLPILERNAKGLRCGQDYFLAYSPEREDPGNTQFVAANIPKVVGGYDSASLNLASQLYAGAVVSVVPVATLEIAEACKILENTYRAVNIALVNELKVLFDSMGIDIWSVIDAAKTKPFGFHAFYPGPGLGGHCIPIDPFYLSWLARKQGLSTRFIELAGEVNSSMPTYVIGKVVECLNDYGKPVRGSKICVIGVAYKKDVDDPRESPSFELIKHLLDRGADVSFHDPFIPELPSMRHYQLPPMTSSDLTREFLVVQDCILISTDHTSVDYALIVKHGVLVIDTRNACRGIADKQKCVRMS